MWCSFNMMGFKLKNPFAETWVSLTGESDTLAGLLEDDADTFFCIWHRIAPGADDRVESVIGPPEAAYGIAPSLGRSTWRLESPLGMMAETLRAGPTRAAANEAMMRALKNNMIGVWV
ncbi:hypothetical protein BDZ89DRAFT_1114321 [Hymenopellis radicata]|nr:hypothetical protein BDZ89DRAFT_1114321 [Hymenopellis radicata]